MMIPELHAVWKQWVETQDALRQAALAVPEHAWQWRPAPQLSNAAELISHTQAGEALYALVIRDTPEQAEQWEVDLTDLHSVNESFKAVGALVQETFERLTIADLTRVCTEEWDPLGISIEDRFDVYWFCWQMVRHKAYHLGQLNYLLQLLEHQS